MDAHRSVARPSKQFSFSLVKIDCLTEQSSGHTESALVVASEAPTKSTPARSRSKANRPLDKDKQQRLRVTFCVCLLWAGGKREEGWTTLIYICIDTSSKVLLSPPTLRSQSISKAFALSWSILRPFARLTNLSLSLFYKPKKQAAAVGKVAREREEQREVVGKRVERGRANSFS